MLASNERERCSESLQSSFGDTSSCALLCEVKGPKSSLQTRYMEATTLVTQPEQHAAMERQVQRKSSVQTMTATSHTSQPTRPITTLVRMNAALPKMGTAPTARNTADRVAINGWSQAHLKRPLAHSETQLPFDAISCDRKDRHPQLRRVFKWQSCPQL